MGTLTALVLGANGMLGHAVLRALHGCSGWIVEGTQVEDPAAPLHLDAQDPPERWTPLFSSRHYDYAVNCIGILKPAVDEIDSASMRRAITVNALFPHRLAEVAAGAGTRVIHISTDGVFSGGSSRRLVETDPTDCPDPYGKTKVLGECRARNVINIRCSIIGRDPVWHKGLIERVLCSPPGAELPGFEDQAWNGVTTGQFAALCRRLMESGAFDRIRAVSPIHHFCPNPAITKYDLLRRIQQASGQDVTIRRARSGAPEGSRLLASRFEELGRLYPCRTSWDEALRFAVADIPE